MDDRSSQASFRNHSSIDRSFYGQKNCTRDLFAVEVQSENDYSPQAEDKIEKKRADYFAAGTLVVWDVNLLSDDVIKSYRAGTPEPRIFKRGGTADAGPALPGWSMPVDDLFIADAPN